MAAVFCVFFSQLVSADTTSDAHTLEYKVKAAYLYNFTKFVKWPGTAFSSQSNSTLNICIAGEDPFGSAINLLKNKTAKGHEVSVTYLEELKPDNNCHVLFISRSLEKNVEKILEKVASKNILTVSDIDGFAMKGGCIRLLVINGKVRFNINIKAAQKAQLKMSAKLLELAKVVIE